MSWDSYIDNLIGHSKDASGVAHADKAVIIGLDGGAPWTSAAHSNSFKLSATEATHIAGVMKSKDFSPFMTGGVTAEGVRYQFLREDEGGKLVLAKKKDHGSMSIQATKTAIIVTHCAEGQQQGAVNKASAVIADYLESLGM